MLFAAVTHYSFRTYLQSVNNAMHFPRISMSTVCWRFISIYQAAMQVSGARWYIISHVLISKVIATAAGNAHARESSRLRKLNRRVDELTARLENKKSRENVKSMRAESQERWPVLLHVRFNQNLLCGIIYRCAKTRHSTAAIMIKWQKIQSLSFLYRFKLVFCWNIYNFIIYCNKKSVQE